MLACKRCHEPVLTNDDGYCFNCVKEITLKLQDCRTLINDLLNQSQDILTDAQRLDLLDQGKKVCNELKQLSKTPYYKGNIKQEIRNLLYTLGGTERDYHDIIGYHDEASYIISLVISTVLIFGSIFLLLANFAPPPAGIETGEISESVESSSTEEVPLPGYNAEPAESLDGQQDFSDEPSGIGDGFDPDNFIMQPMEI